MSASSELDCLAPTGTTCRGSHLARPIAHTPEMSSAVGCPRRAAERLVMAVAGAAARPDSLVVESLLLAATVASLSHLGG
jgi:hypothetical protein